MAFSLPLSRGLEAQGWKVKIRDRERNEPPHVTIMRGTKWWRFGLRSNGFLDREPDPRDVPATLMEELRAQSALLQQEWDKMYPENPVTSQEDSDE